MNNAPSGIEVVFVLLFYGAMFLVGIGIQCIISYIMYRACDVIPHEYRQTSPGQAFLMLIPLFNLIWIFLYTKRLSNSFAYMFASRGANMGDCGEQLGMWWGICAVCCFIPCLNIFFGIGALVVMIMYLVKISECRSRALSLLYQTPGDGSGPMAPHKSATPTKNPYTF
jgi:hypothetical protein